MRAYLRRSIWTKAAALGFICLILLANLWVMLFLTGQTPSLWLQYAFVGSMIWTALAGCGMGLKILLHREAEAEVSHDDAAL